MIQLHDYDILHVLLSGNGQQAGGVVIFLVQGHKKLSNHGSSNFRRDLKKLGATFANQINYQNYALKKLCQFKLVFNHEKNYYSYFQNYLYLSISIHFFFPSMQKISYTNSHVNRAMQIVSCNLSLHPFQTTTFTFHQFWPTQESFYSQPSAPVQQQSQQKVKNNFNM